MAQKIKLRKGQDFIFKSGKRGGSESIYDWNTWLNGELIMLEQSTGEKGDKGEIVGEPTEKKDYTVSTNEMIAKTKSAGKRRYKNVQVSRYDVEGKQLGNGFIMQASDMNNNERIQEDARRQDVKAKFKASRAKRNGKVDHVEEMGDNDGGDDDN